MEKTILVVDDIAANRNLLRETLEPEGYEVLLAGDGVTALKVTMRARPHVILLDVNMPDMDGYKVCQQLKADEITASIPVIFITANDDAQSLVKGFQAGGVDFVGKPFKGEEVLMRVDTHLRLHSLTQSLEKQNEALEKEVKLRKQAEEKAIEANEAKSQFLSFISHEMRAPLNAIIGFSEELIDTLQEESLNESREDAVRIHKGGEHLLELINNLLDLSKIEAGKMTIVKETCDPVEFAQQLAADLSPLARKQNNFLSVKYEPDLCSFKTDLTKLRQTLTNLISNASKFTKDGDITLRVGLCGDTSMLEHSHSNGERQSICFSVKDTGIGMNQEELRRLFQAYQQANEFTSKHYGGTGLGLTISREFCKLLGGDLTVESEPGKGSVFKVTLPLG